MMASESRVATSNVRTNPIIDLTSVPDSDDEESGAQSQNSNPVAGLYECRGTMSKVFYCKKV